MRKPCHKRCAVAFFEFIEFTTVNDMSNDIAYIKRRFEIFGDYAVNIFRCVKRLLWFFEWRDRLFAAVQMCDAFACYLKRMPVVLS